jgi:dienelactone hydrolase
VAEDGQEVGGTYYPPPACPSPLTIVYFPWVRGDKEDVREIIDLLPGDLSYGVFSITPRGCEGGCQEWNPAGWLLDYQAAMEYAKTLPCAGQGPLVTVGSSVGADGAIVACAREARCVAAIAFSPGGYTDEFTYADEVAIAVERGKPVWSVVSEDDPESARLDRPGLGDGYREIVIPGADHGNQLYDERTAQVVQDFVECATNAFASPRCLEALAEDHLAKGNAHLERVKEHYKEHDCEHWIPGAEQAIRECATAIKLNSDSAGAYFCRALGNTYLEEPAKAIDDLERALELGLTGKEKSDAEELLKGLKEKVAAPACSIGPLFFTEGWTESGSPLNPSETCSEDITNEIRATWELYGSCDQWMTVEWYYNGRLTCFYSYKPEGDGPWEGTVYYTDDGKDLLPGTWTASVSVGVKEIGSASCDIPWPAVEPIPATLFLAFNTARPPFDVPSVRRALAMAIDREALLDLLGREDKLLARGLVPPSLWADERYYGQADMPFDLERAKAQLEDSSLFFGDEALPLSEIVLAAPEGSQQVAQFIQAQWKEHLGIEVDLTVVEEDAYEEELEALSPHAFFAGWLAEYPSPNNFLGDAVQDISKLTQWSNAEYDRLVEEAFQEANRERRMELCSQAEVIVVNGCAIVPLYHYIYAPSD